MKQPGSETAAAVQTAIDVRHADRLGDRLACAIRQEIRDDRPITATRFAALLARVEAGNE